MNDEKYSFDEIMEKDGLYYDKIHEEKIFKQTDCIICMEPFYQLQPIVRIQMCMHYFHPECCSKWFNCPN